MQRESLSKSEREVMMVLWKSDTELLQKQIRMRCNERLGKDWKRQTLNTFLIRLEEIGYLTRKPISKLACVWSTAISKEEYLRDELAQLAEEYEVSKEYLQELL